MHVHFTDEKTKTWRSQSTPDKLPLPNVIDHGACVLVVSLALARGDFGTRLGSASTHDLQRGHPGYSATLCPLFQPFPWKAQESALQIYSGSSPSTASAGEVRLCQSPLGGVMGGWVRSGTVAALGVCIQHWLCMLSPGSKHTQAHTHMYKDGYTCVHTQGNLCCKPVILKGHCQFFKIWKNQPSSK